MAKIIVNLGAPGIVIGGITWAACKRGRDQADVATAGSTLTPFDSAGQYWLENPNVTENTFFDVYVTATPASRVLGLFLAPTALDICNTAILSLGGNPIASFSDVSAAAKLCSYFWPRVLDAALRLHPWNFAVKRALLAPDAGAPAYGWSAAFTLPADLLRLLDIDGLTEYKVEDGKVLCNEAALSIRYVYRNDNAASWDVLFHQVVTAYMQFKLAYPLTKSNTTQDAQWKLFTELLRTAKAIDAQEEPGDTVGDFPFLNIRHGGGAV